MGWFEEQIKHRMESDQEAFEDSIFNLSASVIGKKAARDMTDERIITRAAIEEIIKYMGFKPKDSFNDISDDNDIQSILKPYGIMFRDVELDEEWTKEAYGPMLGRLNSTGAAIALLPKPFKGYTYFDYASGKEIIVGKKTSEDICKDAVCFYKPLPKKKLSIIDLIKYMQGCMDVSDAVFYVALMLMFIFAGYLLPSIVDFISDFILKMRSIPMLAITSAFLFAALLARQLFNACSEVIMERVEIKTGINVEAAVMSRVLSLPTSFFKGYSAGELSARINSIGELCELILVNLLSLPLTSIFSLVYLGQIKTYTSALVVPAFFIILLTLLFSLFITFVQMKLVEKIRQYDAEEDGINYALVSGIQKIRLAGAEKRAFAKWANSYNDSAQLHYNPPVVIKLHNTIAAAIGTIGTIILYYTATKAGVSNADYLSFNIAFGFLEGAFMSLSAVALTTASIPPILKLAEPILKAEPENMDGKAVIKRISGNIEVSNLHFAYDTSMPEILKGISFKIKSGEYVAIVGKTGCGKSTLLRLLLGFEMPTKGAVYFDGKDTSMIDMSSLRRKIGTVTQNGSLFQGDIYSNIVITDPSLTISDAWEAAEIAGIADDIRQMPMGMNTMIAEGQGGISGGQKQRLMIARAVAPRPKILLLDEATSALDNITQKKVSDSLDALKCTRIVVAHRLSTIRNCDRIIVLDDGKIVEDGKYQELIDKNGYFAQLVKRQQLDNGE